MNPATGRSARSGPARVLFSREALAGASAPAPLPLKELGTLYTIAQEVRWLDDRRFAVGRWDGSLTVYDTTPGTPPLRLEYARTEPLSGGIRMIAALGDGRFVSSNGAGALAIWSGADPAVTLAEPRYDPALQSATSAGTIAVGGTRYLVVGHDSGWLTVWQIAPGALQLLRPVDIRAAKTANPWGLQTVYQVEAVRPGAVVTAGDNGDLCVVAIPTGRLISRTRYNPTAQRGLNDLAVHGDLIVAVNCAVGPSDHNTWLFRLNPDGTLKELDALNLRDDPKAVQVFAFCVQIWSDAHGPLFFVATEEGLLWVGRIEGTTLGSLGHDRVSANYGAAIACDRSGRLVVAGDNLHLYQIQ